MTITRDDVLNAVTTLTEADPTRTNGGACTYLTEGGESAEPNCVAGMAMHMLDIDIDQLRDFDAAAASDIEGIADELGEVGFADDAIEFLAELQKHADNNFVHHADGEFAALHRDFGSGQVPWSVALAATLEVTA